MNHRKFAEQRRAEFFWCRNQYRSHRERSGKECSRKLRFFLMFSGRQNNEVDFGPNRSGGRRASGTSDTPGMRADSLAMAAWPDSRLRMMTAVYSPGGRRTCNDQSSGWVSGEIHRRPFEIHYVFLAQNNDTTSFWPFREGAKISLGIRENKQRFRIGRASECRHRESGRGVWSWDSPGQGP